MNHHFTRALVEQRLAELQQTADHARVARTQTLNVPQARSRSRQRLAALLAGVRVRASHKHPGQRVAGVRRSGRRSQSLKGS